MNVDSAQLNPKTLGAQPPPLFFCLCFIMFFSFYQSIRVSFNGMRQKSQLLKLNTCTVYPEYFVCISFSYLSYTGGPGIAPSSKPLRKTAAVMAAMDKLCQPGPLSIPGIRKLLVRTEQSGATILLTYICTRV